MHDSYDLSIPLGYGQYQFAASPSAAAAPGCQVVWAGEQVPTADIVRSESLLFQGAVCERSRVKLRVPPSSFCVVLFFFFSPKKQAPTSHYVFCGHLLPSRKK
jgi:hypothetical protein